jgi:diguanylate cyclase
MAKQSDGPLKGRGARPQPHAFGEGIEQCDVLLRHAHTELHTPTVARLGGDEFAVLIEGGADHAHLVALRVIEAFDEPFLVDDQHLWLQPSVGLAVAATDDTDLCADALLKHADVAMYSAKRSGTGGVHTFRPDMHLIDLDELFLSKRSGGECGRRGGATLVGLLGELRHAIDQGDLSVVYQPKVDLRTADIVGVEALVRWPHPQRGLLEPDHFLPLVRQHGPTRRVTELVLAQALDDAVDWRRRNVGVPIAVNLFAPSLADLQLPTRIAQALAERELSADALMVEVTEDLLPEDISRSCTVLHGLRGRGIQVAIDDFGSGYSGLRYLGELPIDEVKLDRQFVAPVLVDPKSATIVRAVIDLAHRLGLTTVAEGVEDAETAAMLREFGCEVAQGFYYSPPLTAPVMVEFLSSQRRAVPVPRVPSRLEEQPRGVSSRYESASGEVPIVRRTGSGLDGREH